MLNDKTEKILVKYSFALVQYSNISTSEIYNFGIVLQDEKRNTIFHIPDITSKIDKCFSIDNKAAVNYTLKEIEDKINLFGSISSFRISDVLSVGRFRPLKTSMNIEETMNMLVEEYISLKGLRIISNESDLKQYDKRRVMDKLNLYAKEIEIDNFKRHKTYSITVKPIDLALVDEENNPYSIATITSPHVENFQDGFISNLFTLQDAQRSKLVKNKFLYTPFFEELHSTKALKNLGWAKEQAHHYGFELLHDKREEAVFEMLQR
jgi:hypothetical protein